MESLSIINNCFGALLSLFAKNKIRSLLIVGEVYTVVEQEVKYVSCTGILNN